MKKCNIFFVWLPYIHQFSAAFIYSILCSFDYVPCAIVIIMSFSPKRLAISIIIMALWLDFLGVEKGHAARYGIVLFQAVHHLGIKSLFPLHARRKRSSLARTGQGSGRAWAPMRVMWLWLPPPLPSPTKLPGRPYSHSRRRRRESRCRLFVVLLFFRQSLILYPMLVSTF